jgi:predicted metalloprotease
VTPLRGSRQLGGARPVGWNSPSIRTGVPQFASQPPDLKGPRRFSRPIAGLLTVLALIMVSGGAFAGYKLINSYDSTVANPLVKPTVKPSEKPLPAPPPPTVTKTVQPVPDAVRLQKNGLYQVGKLPSVNCAVPKIKPDSKANVLRFYQALMPCLAETWEPLVLKAGYPFRQPKLVLAGKTTTGACTGKSTHWIASYCGADETMTMKWEQMVKYYKQDPVTAVNLLTTISHEYSHHVQMLTNILISSASREGWAKTKAAELEWSRRLELQADCLGAAFLSANKKTLDLKGERLRFWVYASKNGGDELSPDKVRDHGSRKSAEYWTTRGFATADPASCNTYVAPSGKVT